MSRRAVGCRCTASTPCRVLGRRGPYLLTYLLAYLLAYLLTYVLTYLLHCRST